MSIHAWVILSVFISVLSVCGWWLTYRTLKKPTNSANAIPTLMTIIIYGLLTFLFGLGSLLSWIKVGLIYLSPH